MASKKRTREDFETKADSNKVVIRRLPSDIKESDVRSLVGPLGTITEVRLVPQWGKSNGKIIETRAFVQLNSPEAAKTVIDSLNKSKYKDTKLKLNAFLWSERETRPERGPIEPSRYLSIAFERDLVTVDDVKTVFPAAKVEEKFKYQGMGYTIKFATVEDASAALKAFSGSIKGAKPFQPLRYGIKKEKKPKKVKVQPPAKKAKTEAPKAKENPKTKKAVTPKKETPKNKEAPKKENAKAKSTPAKENAKTKETAKPTPVKENAKAKATSVKKDTPKKENVKTTAASPAVKKATPVKKETPKKENAKAKTTPKKN